MKSIKQQFKEIGFYLLMLLFVTGLICFLTLWVKWVCFLIKTVWNL